MTGGDWIPVPVPEYQDYYELNLDLESVRSVDRVVDCGHPTGYTRTLRGVELVQSVGRQGFRQVTLSRNGRRKAFRVAALLAQARESVQS